MYFAFDAQRTQYVVGILVFVSLPCFDWNTTDCTIMSQTTHWWRLLNVFHSSNSLYIGMYPISDCLRHGWPFWVRRNSQIGRDPRARAHPYSIADSQRERKRALRNRRPHGRESKRSIQQQQRRTKRQKKNAQKNFVSLMLCVFTF